MVGLLLFDGWLCEMKYKKRSLLSKLRHPSALYQEDLNTYTSRCLMYVFYIACVGCGVGRLGFAHQDWLIHTCC